MVHLQEYFLDGTKIESKANKYTYVWSKSLNRNKSNTENKIKQLISQIDSINQKENEEYGDKDLEELGEDSKITSEKIEELTKKINEKLSKMNEKQEKNSEENQENTKVSNNRKKKAEKKEKSVRKIIKNLEKEYLQRLLFRQKTNH